MERHSHPIKGRIPEAMGKPAEQLAEHEKTIYYERMAFMFEIPTINTCIDGNKLALTVGGVRAYNLENLHNRKTEERFKVFIGFKNFACVNLYVSTDGFKTEIRARTVHELMDQVFKFIRSYDPQTHEDQMAELRSYAITENQFAQLVGKSRMYPFLPQRARAEIPDLQLGDSQANAVVRDYYKDNSFCRDREGDINLWRLYNLFTSAAKTSYIDSFLDRTVNAFSFTSLIKESLERTTDFWYIN